MPREIKGVQCTFDVLDTAGQEEYSSMREQWIRMRKGFILVFSITNKASFEKAKQIVEQIAKVKDEDEFDIVLVGNKCDLEDQREVTKTEAESYAQTKNVFKKKKNSFKKFFFNLFFYLKLNYFETSAKTATNIEEMIFSLFNKMNSRVEEICGVK